MAKRRKEELLDTGGWKSVAIKRAAWHDDADGNGGLICFTGMRSVRISDNVIWNLWKTDPSGSMPAYLLRFISTIKGKESDHLKLYSHPERFYPGENGITEDIDRKGDNRRYRQKGSYFPDDSRRAVRSCFLRYGQTRVRI